MKKKLMLILSFVLVLLSPVMADKLVFTEFGVSYASLITPGTVENNTTGSYDTPVFDVKAGVSILKWADVYFATGFNFFMDRQNMNQYYSFFPLCGGIRINILPDMCVYPSVKLEYGAAIAARHTTMGPAGIDNSWMASYYNFGIGVNWNVTDMSILSLNIERPSISNLNVSYGEMQAVKAGFAWKILY